MNEKLRSNMTVPNALSLVRLAMIPAIACTYLLENYLASLILVATSGFTDLLDGFIARHFNQISSLGKILDPLADKLTVIVVVVCLTIKHPQMLLFLCFMIVKELLMFIGAYILLKSGTRPSESKIWGKLSTLLIYTIMGLTMLFDIISSFNSNFVMPTGVMWGLSIVACLCMFLALIQYTSIFKGILSGKYNINEERFEETEKNED